MITSHSTRSRFILLAVLASLCSMQPAAANTLWVSNGGADGGSCGSSQAPCRSISQAMQNASNNDTIYVGPGRYGNITGNASFTGPGDEHPSPNDGTGANGAGQPFLGCIVCVTKPLHIYSVNGAESTVIAGASGTPYNSTVMIETDGGDFGVAGHGFTITGGNTYGVNISIGSLLLASNMSVSGNIDLGDGTGFFFNGYPYRPNCPQGCFVFTLRILMESNQAINNGTGFNIMVNFDYGSGQIILKDNLALGAGTGFSVNPGAQLDLTEAISAGNVSLVNNVATGGGVGFYADLPGQIQYNTAANNSQAGFVLIPGGAPFYGNSAVGNGGPGAIVYFSPDPFTILPTAAFVPFNGNNFIGNDRSRPVLSEGFEYNPGPGAHCGILNLGGLAIPPVGPSPPIQLLAANNYWGSAQGPSSSGPGDAAGGACDQNNAVTITKPFSATSFAVRARS